MKFFLLLCLILGSLSLFAQDLLKERIRKLTNKKTSIYVESGIFHNGVVKNEAVLKGIRQSYNKEQGFERIVIDFNGNDVPRIYGHINSLEKKLYIDFFATSLDKELQTVQKTRFVEKINFFPVDESQLSVEFKLKSKANMDVFFLDNPARLVIDLKM